MRDWRMITDMAQQFASKLGAMVDGYPALRSLLERSLDAERIELSASEESSADEAVPIERTMAARRKAWTVKELAELLNMSPRSLYDQINSGRLKAYQIGDALRLCPAETLDWLRSRITRPT